MQRLSAFVVMIYYYVNIVTATSVRIVINVIHECVFLI